MTHTSSYRYGAPMLEPAAECRRSSDVRVRYFDPMTGEPCATKPKPLRKQKQQELTAEEKYRQRKEAEREAAEIMENMRNRRRKSSWSTWGRKRAVLVDGVLFESVTKAAEEVGTSATYLGKAISAGQEYVKGHRVAFAEVVR